MNLSYLRMFNILNKGNPRYLVVNVTSRCNAKCVFCHYWKQVDDLEAKNNELTADEFGLIAQKYGEIVKLEIAGGEPYIRKDLSDIVLSFIKHTKPLIVDIPTNGLLTETVIDQTEKILKNSNIILEIQLSFHGDEPNHDNAVGVQGAFKRIVKTYKALNELKRRYERLKIKLNLVYFKDNRQSIENLFEYAKKEMSLDRFSVTYPHGSAKTIDLYQDIDDYKSYAKLALDMNDRLPIVNKKDLHTILFRAIKRVMYKDFESLLKDKSMGAYCHASKRMLVIGETGNVYPCEGKWYLLGNLRELDYDSSLVLKSNATIDFRKNNLGRHKCHCTWGNAILCGIINDYRKYPKILFQLLKILFEK